MSAYPNFFSGPNPLNIRSFLSHSARLVLRCFLALFVGASSFVFSACDSFGRRAMPIVALSNTDVGLADELSLMAVVRLFNGVDRGLSVSGDNRTSRNFRVDTKQSVVFTNMGRQIMLDSMEGPPDVAMRAGEKCAISFAFDLYRSETIQATDLVLIDVDNAEAIRYRFGHN